MSNVDFARFLKHVLRFEILIGRLVLWIERAIIANVSVLDSHESLVAVLGISLVKLFNHALVDCDFIYALAMFNCGRSDLDIDFGTYWTETIVEELLTTQWMIWVKHIEGFHIALIPTGDNF